MHIPAHLRRRMYEPQAQKGVGQCLRRRRIWGSRATGAGWPPPWGTTLAPLRLQLVAQADKALDIGKQLAGLTASKQDLSKQLRVVIVEGDRLATLLRSGIKQRYGIRAEKVAEFGLQPFRGRPRKAKTGPETPGTPSTPPVSTGTAK